MRSATDADFLGKNQSVCGSCGEIYLTSEGVISKDSEHHASFVCASCASKKIYKITFTFSTNKDLNEAESMALINALLLQIEEPTNMDQEPEEYETSQINYKMEEVK